MADIPPPEGIVLAHFIVSDDVERSRRFSSEVLGGRVVFSGDVTYVALSNSWIIINVGGGPTDDKPAVIWQADVTKCGMNLVTASASHQDG
jgi:hypothetical protein